MGCKTCGRELTGKESKRRGMGDSCYIEHLEKRVKALEGKVNTLQTITRGLLDREKGRVS